MMLSGFIYLGFLASRRLARTSHVLAGRQSACRGLSFDFARSRAIESLGATTNRTVGHDNGGR